MIPSFLPRPLFNPCMPGMVVVPEEINDEDDVMFVLLEISVFGVFTSLETTRVSPAKTCLVPSSPLWTE